MRLPLVVALNQMDTAERHGMKVDPVIWPSTSAVR